jgi:hypothetical protein
MTETRPCPLSNVIRIDERIKSHLGRVVRGCVEETLNALLEAEAGPTVQGAALRVDGVLNLSWLREEVSDCYCLDDGRPGVDPRVAVRLMLAGLLTGIVHDLKLMREAQVNIVIRSFIGYGLHEKLPHHSSLTRIRQR